MLATSCPSSLRSRRIKPPSSRVSRRRSARPANRSTGQKLAPRVFGKKAAPHARKTLLLILILHRENSGAEWKLVLGCAVDPNSGGQDSPQATFVSDTQGNGLKPNTTYMGPGGTTMRTDGTGKVVSVNGLIPGNDQPIVIRLNALMSATIPTNSSVTADLSQPGQVTYNFENPIVVSVPLLANPTIESVTVKTDGTYIGYTGDHNYWGMVNSGLQKAVNGDYRVGALSTFLTNNIDSITQLTGTPITRL